MSSYSYESLADVVLDWYVSDEPDEDGNFGVYINSFDCDNLKLSADDAKTWLSDEFQERWCRAIAEIVELGGKIAVIDTDYL